MTEFRFLEGVKGQGRLDAFLVDWHFIRPDPDNDLRDLTTEENRIHIERLKDSISKIGVKDPLVVRKDEEDNIFAIDGRCRLLALAELEAEGREFPSKVKTLPEERGTERKKRMLNMLTVGRDRKNLSDFEFARGLYRSIELGYSEKEVCEEMGWKTVTTLHNYLDSLTMKPKLKEMVDKGQISRTEALRLQKDTNADPGQILQDAEDEHRRLHKKGPAKIKPKHVRAAAQKAKPQEPKPAAEGASDEIAVDRMTEEELLQGLEIYSPTPTPPLPSPQEASAAAVQEGRPISPVPPIAHIDLLPILIELAKESKIVLEHNRSDECSGGFWTQELVDAIRVAERVIGMAGGNGRDPFEQLDAAVSETRALAGADHG